jgi:hypothetical protein
MMKQFNVLKRISNKLLLRSRYLSSSSLSQFDARYLKYDSFDESFYLLKDKNPPQFVFSAKSEILKKMGVKRSVWGKSPTQSQTLPASARGCCGDPFVGICTIFGWWWVPSRP